MSKIIDLSVLVKDPLIFKDTKGDTYTIPGEISTKFVIKLSKYAQDIQKLKEGNDEEKAFEKMQQIVVDILNLDKTKEVTLDFVKERFDDVRFLKIIVDEAIKHVEAIASDPNSNSPESK